MKSDFLSNGALKSVNRIGNIFCPGDEEFPSYSELGCIEHIDIMVENVPPADLADLNLLLTILSFCPKFVLTWMVKSMARSHWKEGPIQVLFRQLDLGLRGMIFGTYYSGKVGSNYTGKNPHEIVGFSVSRVTD
ncbi:hypothetical protein ACFLR1_01480 [Bacteroidota bacterium]